MLPISRFRVRERLSDRGYLYKTIERHCYSCRQAAWKRVRQPASRLCQHCGKEFTTMHPFKMYCSRKCAYAIQLSKANERNRGVQRLCKQCESKIDNGKKYCKECITERVRNRSRERQRRLRLNLAYKEADKIKLHRYLEQRYGSLEAAMAELKRKYPNKSIRARHRRIARIRGLPHTLTAAEWRRTLDHFVYRCAYCGKECDPLQQDHFIPVAKGGSYTKDNIIPACSTCNNGKNASAPLEWLVMQDHGLVKYVMITQYLAGKLI